MLPCDPACVNVVVGGKVAKAKLLEIFRADSEEEEYLEGTPQAMSCQFEVCMDAAKICGETYEVVRKVYEDAIAIWVSEGFLKGRSVFISSLGTFTFHEDYSWHVFNVKKPVVKRVLDIDFQPSNVLEGLFIDAVKRIIDREIIHTIRYNEKVARNFKFDYQPKFKVCLKCTGYCHEEPSEET